MCDYMPWEQISVLLEEFMPESASFWKRKKELLHEISNTDIQSEQDLAFRKLINLHRAINAIYQAHGELSAEVIFSYRQVCVLAKCLNKELSDSDLLRCPLEDFDLLIDEAVIISAQGEDECVLKENALRNFAEFQDYVHAIDKQESPVPLFL